MPIFEIETPNGKVLEIEAADEATALRGAREWSTSQQPATDASAYVPPDPPPGEIVHSASGSYVTGRDDLSVDTTGMSQEERNTAAAALAGRRDAPMSRGLMPIFQGNSMSWGDEAVSTAFAGASAVRGADPVQAYNYAQELQRQELEQERAEHPVRSFAGQMAGALTWVPRMATAAAPLAATPAAGKVAAGVGTGIALGAVEGAGAGSGLEDRAVGAGVGGAIGGIVGMAAPMVGSGLKTAANKFLDWRDVSKNLRTLGLDRPAGDIAMRALDADQAFSGSGRQRIISGGDGAMMADAGPSSRSVLDTAMQQGGPAMRVGTEAVEARAAGANGRLTGVLDAVLGKPEGIYQRGETVRQGTKVARGDAYADAYAVPIDYSAPEARRIEALLQRVPNSALEAANKLMRLKGRQSKQILANIADDGTVTYTRMPDVEQLDYITRGLREAASSSEGQGALGKQTAVGAALEGLANDIRGPLRRLVPEYGKALDTAADPIQEIQSLKFGYDLLRPSVTRDEVALKVTDMTAAETRGARQGLRSYIDDTVANVTAVASDPNLDAREALKVYRDLSSRAAREKIRTLLGNDTATATLMKELDQAGRALELRAGTAQNARTFGRTVVNDAVKAAQEPGPVGALARGRPMNASQRAVQGFFGTTDADLQTQRDEIYRQIAELFTKPRGPEVDEAIARLYKAYQALPKNAQTAGQVGARAAAGTLLAPLSPLTDAARNLLGVSRGP